MSVKDKCGKNASHTHVYKDTQEEAKQDTKDQQHLHQFQQRPSKVLCGGPEERLGWVQRKHPCVHNSGAPQQRLEGVVQGQADGADLDHVGAQQHVGHHCNHGDDADDDKEKVVDGRYDAGERVGDEGEARLEVPQGQHPGVRTRDEREEREAEGGERGREGMVRVMV